MIPYFQALFIQRHGMISALMIYGHLHNMKPVKFAPMEFFTGFISFRSLFCLFLSFYCKVLLRFYCKA